MRTLNVATDQDSNPSNKSSHDGCTKMIISSGSDSDFSNAKRSNGSFSSNTVMTASTFSSWSCSPSSLSLQPTFSEESSSGLSPDDCLEQQSCDEPKSFSTNKRDVTTERKKWIEQTLLNKQHQSYSTNVRDECRKNLEDTAVAIERKKWIEETLLVKSNFSSDRHLEVDPALLQGRASSQRKWIEETLLTNNYQNDNPIKLNELKDVSSSVTERRQWLSKVTHLKSAGELEEEVRKEQLALKEEKRRLKELEMAMAQKREEEIARKQLEKVGEEGQAIQSEGVDEEGQEIALDEKWTIAEESEVKESLNTAPTEAITAPIDVVEMATDKTGHSASEANAYIHMPAEKAVKKKRKILKKFAMKLSPKKHAPGKLFEI